VSSRRPPDTPQQSLFDYGAKPKSEGDGVKAWTVGELVRHASRALEARYGAVVVDGELTNLKPAQSGHVYFTLKDADGQLSCVLFRREASLLKFRLTDGLKVRARGKLTIYPERGSFQMMVDALEPAGLGQQQVAFELLKRKLQAEGLFDQARKRPLPKWPRRIGLVTSPTGAAVRDILRIAERRGRCQFLIAPCQVQGDSAPFEIRAALRFLDTTDVDVIIVGRGGGSSEDLAAFNDEGVARAIAAARVPTVSAVGHEVDFTIADFVADHRAPTPSAAAELVVPLWADAQHRLDDARVRLTRAGQRTIAEARQRLDGGQERAASALRQIIAKRRRLLDDCARRLAALHPKARLARDRHEMVELQRRLEARIRRMLDERKRAFAAAAGKLDALSPLAVLERGFSLTRDESGHVITSAAQVKPGDAVEVKLARGTLDCRVESSDSDE
jgi:exodeoxyribonuclease VII large subunit